MANVNAALGRKENRGILLGTVSVINQVEACLWLVVHALSNTQRFG